jgi:hypothetical protein
MNSRDARSGVARRWIRRGCEQLAAAIERRDDHSRRSTVQITLRNRAQTNRNLLISMH